MLDFVIWASLLVAQNASHTASSRAKNSSSLLYSTLTGVLSNGIWFASLSFAIKSFLETNGVWERIGIGLFYVTFTVIGTVAAHAVCLRWERDGGGTLKCLLLHGGSRSVREYDLSAWCSKCEAWR